MLTSPRESIPLPVSTHAIQERTCTEELDGIVDRLSKIRQRAYMMFIVTPKTHALEEEKRDM